MAKRDRTTESHEPSVETPVETVQVEGNLAVQPAEAPAERFNVEHLQGLKTVSEQVRYLSAQGLTRSEIVKVFPLHLNRTILYQHVRNVLITPLKSKN